MRMYRARNRCFNPFASASVTPSFLLASTAPMPYMMPKHTCTPPNDKTPQSRIRHWHVLVPGVHGTDRFRCAPLVLGHLRRGLGEDVCSHEAIQVALLHRATAALATRSDPKSQACGGDLHNTYMLTPFAVEQPDETSVVAHVREHASFDLSAQGERVMRRTDHYGVRTHSTSPLRTWL